MFPTCPHDTPYKRAGEATPNDILKTWYAPELAAYFLQMFKPEEAIQFFEVASALTCPEHMLRVEKMKLGVR